MNGCCGARAFGPSRTVDSDPPPATLQGSPASGTARLAATGAGFDVVATCGYIVAVKAVTVRELKNRLSAYLREVAAGEVVLVTDRGRVVAELRRPSAEALPSPAEQALDRLVAAGVLTIGLPQDPSSYRRTAVRIARSSQTLLDAERAR